MLAPLFPSAVVDLTKEEIESIEKAAGSQPVVRVCDQSEDFEYDIFEETIPERSNKAQSKLD